MYSEQLEKLIELALVDGIITDKKKQILFKKAELEGIDLDEFEMVLEAKVFEINKAIHLNTPINTKVQNEQIVIKTEPTTPIKSLINQLNEIEEKMGIQLQHELDKRREERGKFSVKNVVGAVKEFIPGSSLISMGKELLGQEELSDEEKDTELRDLYETKIVEKKKEVISNSIIPTSEKDILEYLSISVFNTTIKVNQQNGLAKAWKEKSLQIINYSKKKFASNTEIQIELDKYNNELTSLKNNLVSGFRNFFQ